MTVRRTDILVRVALFVAMFVVCLNAWLAFRSVQVLDESQYWVAHTWQVINTLERIIGSMKDVESGDRGYLLTADPAYLEPYTNASRQIPREFHELLALTSDNPQRQAQIAAMRALIDRRLSVLQSGIDRFRAGNTDRAGLLIQSGTGKAEMDQLRAMTKSMQNEERNLLVQRIARSRRAKIDSQLTILIVSIIDILLITLILWLLNRERALRQKTAATADRLAKLQAISDVGLTQLAFSQLVESLLDRLRDVIRADGVVFCNWRNGEIEVTQASGVNATPGLRVKLEPDNPLYTAGINRKVITLEGPAAQSIPLEGMRREMYAILILPVISSGEVAALLVAGRRGQVPFGDQDETLLTVVADRIGIALDRANAYEAERQARQLAEKNAELAQKSAEEVRSLNAELEERVQLRTAELEASNRELEAFSYSVSHDLRSPLRSVDGFSLALEEDFAAAMNDDGRDYIRRIRAGVQRMGQLIDSLLQLSRITRAELTRERVNVSDLAADVARELRAENPQRNLTFRIEPGLEADADPRLLRIALENLLGNAVKFTSRKPEALIEVGRSPETGEFFVRDNGAGFDMQYANKLFNAFQRLHGEREFKGSGIGLATVSRVIRRHQGIIRTESAVDNGATFWFTVG
jgi:signal transduction histidine kinase/CHASE3 domain sensor protein